MANYRSYSRQSTHPGSSLLSSSRTPTFQPPSFYAAAAGLSYTSISPTPFQSNQEDQRAFDTNISSPGSYISPVIPISYPTQHDSPSEHEYDSWKDADGEVNGMSSRSSRSSLLSRSLSRAIPRHGRSEKDKEKGERKRRKSQLGDIPKLEAQLLPSLRDTIDRMTHPPKPKTTNIEPYKAHSADSQTESLRTPSQWMNSRSPLASPAIRSALPLFSHTTPSMRSPSVVHESPAYSSTNTCTSPTISSTPKELYASDSNNINNDQLPQKAINSPRSAVRSALRTPGASSMASSQIPGTSSSAASKSTTGKSLRSMKSMTSVKSPVSHPSPVAQATLQVRSPNFNSLSPRVREDSASSRTPSGSKAKTKPRTNSTATRSNKAIPSMMPPASFASPQLSGATHSCIPRPSFVSNQANDSCSELERHYDRSFTSGRLTVANASIVLSSSESEESEQERDRWRSRSKTWTSQTQKKRETRTRMAQTPDLINLNAPGYASPPRTSQARRWLPEERDNARPRIGLGLQLGLRNQVSQVGMGDDDERSVYDDDEQSVYGSQEETEESRLPASTKFNKPTWDNESRGGQEDHDDRQRRDALLGIVNGLQMDFGLQPNTTGARSRLSQSESDSNYHEQGLAISGSMEVDAAHTYSREERGRRISSRSSSVVKCSNEDISSEDPRMKRPKMRRRSTAERSSTILSNSAHSPRHPSPLEASSKASPNGSEHQYHRSSSVPARSSRSEYPPGTKIAEQHATNSAAGRDFNAKPTAEKKMRDHSSSVSKTKDTAFCHSIQGGNIAEHDANQSDYQRSFRQRTEELAIREREGFGIPSSLSYGAADEWQDLKSEEQPSSHPAERLLATTNSTQLPHLDSDLSSINEDRWQEPSVGGGLSTGAEALFRTLSTSTTASSDDDRRERLNRRNGWSRASAIRCYPVQEDDRKVQKHKQPGDYFPSSMSASSSAPSVYEEKSFSEASSEEFPSMLLSNTTTLRSTMSQPMYSALLSEYGSTEMQRQEIIYQLSYSEDEFVASLRTVVRLFILPLRHRDSKKWIPGIPSKVSRLFDWLDDIVNLHVALAEALKNARRVWKTGGVVMKLSETLRGFIPRLEVYQPYIVRVDAVTDMVKRCVADVKDEFGEFLRLREKDRECAGWTLSDLLLEPLERISIYPQTFMHLWQLTPRAHPDHLPTLSLYQSTLMIMRVMKEVQVREEEYDFVKDVSSNIEGLPPAVQLARRERRLLWHGMLLTAPKGSNGSGAKVVKVDSTPSFRRPEQSRHTKRQQNDPSQRASRLVSAIEGWDTRRRRAGSVNSSVSSALSSESFTSNSSAASLPATPRWEGHSERYGALNTPQIVFSHSPTPDDQDDQEKICRSSFAMLGPGSSAETATIQAFIFNDVIVLVTDQQADKHNVNRWKLLDGRGIARLLGVSEDLTSSGEPRILLDLLPLTVDELQTGVIPETTSITTLQLGFPPSFTEKQRSEVTVALHRSNAYMLRSLSFPSHSGKYLTHGPQVDLEHDTQQSVMSILSTGLPLPKSPSVQFHEVARGRAGDPVEQEREERGWWSLRFQQVLREMQRQDPVTSLDLIKDLGEQTSAEVH